MGAKTMQKKNTQTVAPDSTVEESEGDFGFTRGIYRDFARMSQNLTNTEYRILDASLSFADTKTDEKKGRREGGNCFPSLKQVAQKCGKAPKTVEKVLPVLETIDGKWLCVASITSRLCSLATSLVSTTRR